MNAPDYDLCAHDFLDIKWRKSSYSAAENDCVELADLPNGMKAVRDSKMPDCQPVKFSAREWAIFCRTVSERKST
jgi:uncharacterized protein DUF397